MDVTIKMIGGKWKKAELVYFGRCFQLTTL
jgi:hypothetical protein